MGRKKTWSRWVLYTGALVLTGCFSSEEPVPKYDYGKSAAQPEEQGNERWTYGEYHANSSATAFAKKDLDGDGGWNVEEFRRADMKDATSERAARVFQLMDSDGDGRMSPEEHANRKPEVWIVLMDSDENGSVSEVEYSEFDSWLIKTGHCRTVFRLMDRDGDGAVTLDEFVHKPPEVEFYKQDSNGDSQLSPTEFISRCRTEDQIAAQTKVFQDKDFDHDGQMSVEEYLMSPEQRRFRSVDSDGDGALSLAEYGTLDDVASSAEYAQRLFEARDTNGDAKLQPNELLASSPAIDFAIKDLDGDGGWNVEEFHRAEMTGSSPQWARRTFEIMDRNHDGRMNAKELASRAWFMYIDADESGSITEKEYGDHHPELAKTGHVKTILALVDTNQDGVIDMAEYDAMPPDVELLKRDRNGDALLSLEEFLPSKGTDAEVAANTQIFRDKDFNHDGLLTVEEYATAPAKGRFRGLDSDDDGALTATEYAAADEASGPEAYALRLFQTRDANGDERLQPDELNASSPLIAFAKKDLDGDGGWSVEEFRRAEMANSSPQWARRTFEIMDRNNDGMMSLEELRNRAWFMFIDADESETMTEAEYASFNPWIVEIGHCGTIFGLMDRDKDGVVTPEEFDRKPPEVEFYKKDRSGDSLLSLEEFLPPSNDAAKIAAATKVFQDKDFDHDGQMSVEDYLMSPEQRHFRCADSDGDGTLSLAEYGMLDKVASSAEYAERLFEARDTNGDGRLQPNELLASSPAIDFVTRDANGDDLLTEDEYLSGTADDAALQSDLFGLRDVDGDGALSQEEFTSKSRSVDFRKADGDGDGGLDLEEFHQADMRNASSEWTRKTFLAMDIDNDQRISLKEFHRRSPAAWFTWMDANMDENLTSEEFAFKNQAFVKTERLLPLVTLMDVNGDGRITKSEYCTHSVEVGFVRQDSDANGRLDLQEYSSWAKTPEEAVEVKSRFGRKDLDQDGFLSLRELSFSVETSDFWAFDRNDNSRLEIEEFCLLTDHEDDAVEDGQQQAGGQQSEQGNRLHDRGAWKNFFNSVDTNHDGQVALDEFQRQPRKWRFIRLDVDGNGVLASSDFLWLEGIPDLSAKMKPLLDGKDVNKDGQLTVDEFLDQAK